MAEPARMLEINLDSTIAFVDAVRPHMADGGAAVIIASNTSYFPVPEDLQALFEGAMPPEGTAAFADRVSDSFMAYLLSKRGVRFLVSVNYEQYIEPGAVAAAAVESVPLKSRLGSYDHLRHQALEGWDFDLAFQSPHSSVWFLRFRPAIASDVARADPERAPAARPKPQDRADS